MAPKSSSTAPEMRTTAPTLSSRVGLEGFMVTVVYACRDRRGTCHCITHTRGPCAVSLGNQEDWATKP